MRILFYLSMGSHIQIYIRMCLQRLDIDILSWRSPLSNWMRNEYRSGGPGWSQVYLSCRARGRIPMILIFILQVPVLSLIIH